MTTKTIKPTASEIARDFYTAAKAGNWRIDARSEIVTIIRNFTPNDNNAFVACDMEYFDILSRLRAKGGSMWGTDGGGIGGYSALMSGCFKMNVSGVGKRVIAEILKLQAAE